MKQKVPDCTPRPPNKLKNMKRKFWIFSDFPHHMQGVHGRKTWKKHTKESTKQGKFKCVSSWRRKLGREGSSLFALKFTTVWIFYKLLWNIIVQVNFALLLSEGWLGGTSWVTQTFAGAKFSNVRQTKEDKDFGERMRKQTMQDRKSVV